MLTCKANRLKVLLALVSFFIFWFLIEFDRTEEIRLVPITEGSGSGIIAMSHNLLKVCPYAILNLELKK